MTKLTMYQVDAFATELFSGNPAAVLVLDDWLSDVTMQAIAAENNLAETAFAKRTASGWDLRWFTPVHEVDFCGHATLATSHVLANELGVEGELVLKRALGHCASVVATQAISLIFRAFLQSPSKRCHHC